MVRIAEYGDSTIAYEVLYWLADYMRAGDIDCLARERVWYAFRRAGLEMPFPKRHITVERHRFEQTPAQALVREVIDEVDVLAPLTAEERATLARSCRTAFYAPGEEVLRRGEPGDSMFVIVSGRAEILIPAEHGGTKPVAILGERECFGEMALFTGEPRTADVRAATELELVEIGKTALGPLLHANQELAALFSRIIAERQADLRARAHAATEAPEQTVAATILTRIRRFFSLQKQ